MVRLIKEIDDRLLVDATFVKAIKTKLSDYIKEVSKLLKDKTPLIKLTPLKRALDSIDERVEKALRKQELKNGELKTKRQLVGEALEEFTNRIATSVSDRFKESKRQRVENQGTKAKRKNEKIKAKNGDLANYLGELADGLNK